MAQANEISILAVLRDQLTAPAQRVKQSLLSIREAGSALNQALSPLTGRVAALAAGLGSLAAASKAIELARQEAEARARLNVALDRAAITYERIVKLADELQQRTIFDNEAITAAAARMAVVGIEASKLPRLLQLAADTASGLGVSLEEAADNITKIASGGEARTFNQRLAGLRELNDAGASAAEKIAFLESRFSGLAEAVGATPFGRATQAANAFQDQLKRLGVVLVPVKTALLDGLVRAVERFAGFAESAAFVLITEALRRIAGYIPEILTGFAALFAVGRAQAFVAALLPLVSVLASVATNLVAAAAAMGPVGLALAGIVAAASALALQSDAFASVGRALREGFEGATSGIARAFDLLSQGRIEVADFFAFVLGRLRSVGLGVAAAFEVVSVLLRGLFESVTGFFAMVLAAVPAFVARVARLVKDGVLGALRSVAGALDAVFDALGVKLDLATRIPRLDFLDEFQEDLDKVFLGATETFGSALPRAIEQSRKAISQLGADVLENELNNQEAIESAVKRVAAAKQAAAQRELEAERAKNAAILRDRLELEDAVARARAVADAAESARDLAGISIERAKRLLAEVGAASQESVRAALVTEFERQFAAAKISAQEFADFRRELEVGFFEQQAKLRLDAINQERDKLSVLAQESEQLARQAEIASQLAAARQAAEPDSDEALRLTRAAFEAEKARTENVKAQKDASSQILQLEKERLEFVTKIVEGSQKVNAVREQLASDLARQAKEEIARVLADVQPLLDQVASGAEAPIRAAGRIAEAALDVQARIAFARREIEGLLSASDRQPALPAVFDRLREELDALAQKPVDVKLDFAKSIGDSLRKAEEEINRRLATSAFRIDAGIVLPQKEFASIQGAIDAYAAAVLRAREATDALVAANPELIDQFAALGERVARAEQELAARAATAPGGSAASFFEGIGQGVTKAIGQFDDLRRAGADLGASLVNNLTDGLIDVFVRGQGTLKQYLQAFSQFIASAIAKILLLKAVSAGLGLLGGAAPAAAATPAVTAAHSGGFIRKFAWGGAVPGPAVNADVVPAMLTPGEYVQPRDVVEHYGAEVMEALRRKLIPAALLRSFGVGPLSIPQPRSFFAEGGPVLAGKTQQPLAAALPLSADLLDRILASGDAAMLRWLERNADSVNSRLRRRG